MITPTDSEMMRERLRTRGEEECERRDIWQPYERTETMDHYWRMEAQDWETTHDHHDEDEYESFDEDADRHDADQEAYAASL